MSPEVEEGDSPERRRTRLVAVTGASNLVGTRPDVAAITAAEQEEVAASLRRAVERHGGSAWPA